MWLFFFLFLQSYLSCHEYSTEVECLKSNTCRWVPQGKQGFFQCQEISSVNKRGSYISEERDYIKSTRLNCQLTEIQHIMDEPCYLHPEISYENCGCGTVNENTYLIPRQPYNDIKAMSNETILNETIFVFIHSNKAAGETIKNIAFRAMKENKWDGAGFGTKNGWQYLEKLKKTKITTQESIPASNSLDVVNRGKIMYSNCGNSYSTFEDVDEYLYDHSRSLLEAQLCPLRFIWGSRALGLCDHFPGQPCIYFTSLRHPISRALSDYYYFCVDGSEGKKKWTKSMKLSGNCNLGPVEWFIQMRTSPYFYVERLSRGCDTNCGVQAALENLSHPCMRYLIVERLNDGLQNLMKIFSPAFTSAIESYLNDPKKLNKRGQGTDLSKLKYLDLKNSSLAKLEYILRDDILIYNQALRQYEQQWSKPLSSCNKV